MADKNIEEIELNFKSFIAENGVDVVISKDNYESACDLVAKLGGGDGRKFWGRKNISVVYRFQRDTPEFKRCKEILDSMNRAVDKYRKENGIKTPFERFNLFK